MATKFELDSLIKDAQERIKEFRQTIVDCDRKIARLESVYRELGNLKSDFRNARKNTEEIFEMKTVWQGERHTAFQRAGSALDDSYGSYYARLDDAQDAVNRRIGELRAQKLKLLPRIDGLLLQINQWTIEIANILN